MEPSGTQYLKNTCAPSWAAEAILAEAPPLFWGWEHHVGGHCCQSSEALAVLGPVHTAGPVGGTGLWPEFWTATGDA